jgi:pimeloyl-ACP methyl ester carboxylesterase
MLPLVLLHGYPLDHTMWFGVIAALGSGIRSIAPDLRGFGKTGEPHGDPSIDAMAEDVLELLRRDEIDRYVLAGMSMGGYVALAMAELAPDSIAGLAMINSQCYADSDDTKKSRREMIKKVRAEGPRAAAAASIPKMFAANHTDNPDYQAFVSEGAEKAGMAGICWALEAMARRPERCATMAESKTPTMIVHSAEDKFIPIDRAREMAKLRPDIHFVTVPNAGHAAVIESPDQVAAALRRFVELCSFPGGRAEENAS